MTENKIEFLSEPYINPEFTQYVEIERFVKDLHTREFFLNKRGTKVKIIEY